MSFNGTAATSFTVNSATSITATVPAGATTGTVSVTTPGGTATGPTFTVGALPNPEINVQQAGNNVTSGSTFSGFAATTIGSSAAALTFTIQNTSATDALTLGAFTFTGPFALSGTAPTTVAAGGAVTFDVVFAPTQSGANTGSVSIANNDQDENPYVVTFSGIGNNPVPTITTLSPNSAITGSTISSLTITGTNFVSGATVNFAGTSYPTTSQTGTQITVAGVAVPTTAGPYDVVVINPAPSAGQSVAATFTAEAPFSGLIEDFETSLSKTVYNTGSLALTSGSWTFDEAALGALANDKKNGSKSARLRGGSIYMNFDKPNGAGTITVQAARYGTDAASSFVVEVSNDGGASFTAYTSAVTPVTATLTGYTFTADVNGAVRIRIRHVGGSVGNDPRLNIDDVSISDYVPTGPEITVKQDPSTNVNTGGTVSVATTAVGGIPTDVAFTITNDGVQPLTLGTITAANAEFSLTGSDPSNTTLAANGGTANFTVRFAPAGAGTRTGSISIPNNDVTGNEDPFVINLSGSATAVYYAKATGLLNNPATFGVNPDGTGLEPTSFTAAGQLFTVTGTGRTLAANLTISGTGSRLVVAPNAELIIPSGFNYTGPLDLGAGSTLVVQNNTLAYTLGTVDATSTVDYAQSGTFAVPASRTPNGGYGNLKLTNGTKTLPTGSTTIRGNFTVENVTGFNGFAGNSASTYTTLSLEGNLTLLGTVTHGPTGNGYTLLLDGTSPQTLTGNGNVISLFRLTNNNVAGASLAAGGTDMRLGNSSTGGLTQSAGTTLALNGNTVTVAENGVFSGTGTLTAASTATLAVAKTGNADPGNVYFGTGETLGTLTLNATGSGDELTLGSNVTVNNLNLTDGVLALNGKALTLNGPVTTTTAAQLRGGTGSSLIFTGTGSIGALDFATGTATLSALVLNRDANVTVALSDVLTVTNATLIRGSLFFTPTTRLVVTGTLTGGSADSYVNALTLQAGANAAAATLSYPLGGALGFYRPLTLDLAQTTSAAVTGYTARIVEQSANPRGVTAPLTNVSAIRYFALNKENGGGGFTSGTLTLTFGTDDGANDQSTLRLAASSGGAAFADLGTPTITGTFPSSGFATGTITASLSSLPADVALATSATADGANPLPVTLVEFTARPQGHGALLRWTTAQEKNNARFEVQRSADGREFRTIGSVAGSGNSTVAHTYALVDPELAAGTWYYRLRQVDFDGTATLSDVATLSKLAAQTASVYPNPARNRVYIAVEGAAQWVITDMLGRTVLEGHRYPTDGIDISQLPAGSYQIHVTTGAQRLRQQLIKAN
ncbi:hypothetical protein B0919_13335 [Hymenobacter sp. CRA2]|nr:hypothetical protein B0919_13335 [Hymenobacter sp. CRA2]